jgi:RNA polymerase sigma-70 factor (ECF subfamily)
MHIKMKNRSPDITKLLHNKNPLAIDYLYDDYGSSLYGIVLKILKCSDLAQKVLQDTFLKAWLYGEKYDPSKGQIFTWLLNIARNTAIDETRTAMSVLRKIYVC